MIALPSTQTTSNIRQHTTPPSSVSSPFNSAMQRALCKIYGAKAIDRATPVTPTPFSLARTFCNKITGATSIIVDNSNIHQGGRGKGDRVDYGDPVLNWLGGDRLISASIVVTQPLGEQRPNQVSFYSHLTRLGWCVYRHLALRNKAGELSENETFVDGDVRTLIRAAADSPDCDSIVVMSGDGGMTNAVKYARLAGKKVYVVAWEGTLHPALAAAATAHLTIEELRPLIARVLH